MRNLLKKNICAKILAKEKLSTFSVYDYFQVF